MPEKLDPDDEKLPLDFTVLSNRDVGATHSRFAVRHAFALYLRAGVATEILGLKREHRIAMARFRAANGSEYRTDKACAQAFSLTKKGKRLERDLDALEIRIVALDAILGGYDDIVKAASREMARRDSERAPRD